MSERTLTLRADLVDKLEALAERRGLTVEDLLCIEFDVDIPISIAVNPANQWVIAVAKGMAEEDIDWIDDPNAAANSRYHLESYLEDKLKTSQALEEANG